MKKISLLLVMTLAVTLFAAPELTYYNAFEAPFEITGMPWRGTQGELRRLPLEMDGKLQNASEIDSQLVFHTAGAVIRFRCNSDIIRIRAELHHVSPQTHMPVHGFAGMQLAAERGSNQSLFRCCCSSMENCAKAGKSDFTGTISLGGEYKLNCGGKMRDLTLFLPLYSGVKNITIGIDAKASIKAPSPYRISAPILFYGSSITQGCAASTPATCYTTMLCRELDAPQLNFGFSSGAHGEAAMAELIAEQNMSAFVMDYDYNASNAQELKDRHYAFYKIIREKQPELPIVILSGPRNPSDGRAKEFNGIIKETYDRAIAEGDTHVWYVDGTSYYKDVPWRHTTVDLTHPTNLGFYLMYARILPVLKEALGVD